MIYGPSYVSLEWALHYYRMIPERVEEITSVTLKRKQSFFTPLGTFSYEHTHPEAYPVGITRIEPNEYQKALIATPEKAVCDLLMLRRGKITSRSELKEILYDDFRFEEERVQQLDRERLKLIAAAYPIVLSNTCLLYWNDMNEMIKQMIGRYQPKDLREQKLALQEILQEIALVGLWRGNFFEHAAFYGGTALRILYGLDRFSEDLDFTLHSAIKEFKWDKYKQSLITELKSYGFEADFDGKQKAVETSVQSAFLKTNTNLSLLTIGIKKEDLKGSHPETTIKIKVEIDTTPFTGYRTQQVFLRDPIPIPVTSIAPSDLFACKLNAALFRVWKNRVKGRDWYDVVWFIRRGIPLNLSFFSSCLHQLDNLTNR